MQNGEECFDISKFLTMGENAPFFGNVLDLEDYIQVAEECVKAIAGAQSIRQVVLETWLLVDYATRELLSNLWRLKEFNDEENDFDLRYQLLPGFEQCLRLIERVLAVQRARPEAPDDYQVRISPASFLLFFMKRCPDEFEQFRQIEEKYYQEHHPELAKQEEDSSVVFTTSSSILSRGERFRVNKAWVEALQGLDENWFRLARRLNKARNRAAHSHDSSKILSAFGYSGANAEAKTKQECIQMIDTLLGITRKPENTNTEN